MNMSDNQITQKISSFSGDTYFQKEIERLIQKHNIQCIVETGTYLGDTTLAFARMVPTVYTIENNQQFATIAQNKFKSCPNIKLYIGNSPQVLHALVPSIQKKTLFFLDAHWYNYWPVLDELTKIAMNPKHACVVVIHDFYVPNTSFGYDSYIKPTGFTFFDNIISFLDMLVRLISPQIMERIFRKQRLDWQYISKHIKSINPSFSYHYNKKAIGKKRGIIFIEF